MKPYFEQGEITLYCGDSREVLVGLPEVNCIVTSPPYFGLRDYGNDAQIGLEKTPAEYVASLLSVLNAGPLSMDGTLWLNLGDTYSHGPATNGISFRRDRASVIPVRGKRMPRGSGRRGGGNVAASVKRKNLIGIPWRVAFALQEAGWYLRSDIIWHKPNPMSESVTDRPTKSHEYIFLLSKSESYFYDAEAIAEPTVTPLDSTARQSFGGGKLNDGTKAPSNRMGEFQEKREFRNKRDVWTIATRPYAEAHFATYPEKLIEPCVKAGCPKDGTVLDPFAGAGTTLLVAKKLGRKAIGVELNEKYCELIVKRLSNCNPLFDEPQPEVKTLFEP